MFTAIKEFADEQAFSPKDRFREIKWIIGVVKGNTDHEMLPIIF